MKKHLVLLLLVCIILTLAATAFSETSEASKTTESSYPEYTVEVEEQFDGVWFIDENAGLTYYVPSDWNIHEVSEEQIKEGFTTILADPNQTMVFSLAFEFMDKDFSAADIAMELTNRGIKDAEVAVLNGFETVGYSVDESTFGLVQTYVEVDKTIIAYSVISVLDQSKIEEAQNILLSIVAGMDITSEE